MSSLGLLIVTVVSELSAEHKVHKVKSVDKVAILFMVVSLVDALIT